MASLFCWGGNCHFLFVFMHSFMGEFGDSGSCDFSISRVLPTRSVILLLRQNSTLSNQADLSIHKAVLLMMMFNKWLLFLSSFRVFSTSSSQDLTSCWTFKCDKPFRFKCPGWSPSDKRRRVFILTCYSVPKHTRWAARGRGWALLENRPNLTPCKAIRSSEFAECFHPSRRDLEPKLTTCIADYLQKGTLQED